MCINSSQKILIVIAVIGTDYSKLEIGTNTRTLVNYFPLKMRITQFILKLSDLYTNIFCQFKIDRKQYIQHFCPIGAINNMEVSLLNRERIFIVFGNSDRTLKN